VSQDASRIGKLILVPATLAVTLLRLVGDLQGWSPRPTLIRDPSRNEDVLSRGTLVLAEETGAVLGSEWRIADARGPSMIEVEYTWFEALGLFLPAEMGETYDGPGGAFSPVGTTLRHGRGRVLDRDRALFETPPLRGHDRGARRHAALSQLPFLRTFAARSQP